MGSGNAASLARHHHRDLALATPALIISSFHSLGYFFFHQPPAERPLLSAVSQISLTDSCRKKQGGPSRGSYSQSCYAALIAHLCRNGRMSAGPHLANPGLHAVIYLIS